MFFFFTDCLSFSFSFSIRMSMILQISLLILSYLLALIANCYFLTYVYFGFFFVHSKGTLAKLEFRSMLVLVTRWLRDPSSLTPLCWDYKWQYKHLAFMWVVDIWIRVITLTYSKFSIDIHWLTCVTIKIQCFIRFQAWAYIINFCSIFLEK